jgi:hypothetical protein
MLRLRSAKTALGFQHRRQFLHSSDFLLVPPFFLVNMWRPATRQITGTNEGVHISVSDTSRLIFPVVPLGQRRRFGPAPAEDMAPPQLAQPSPSAYPRPPQQDPDSPARGRDDSPTNGGAAGKLNELENKPRLPFPVSLSSFELDSSARDFQQLTSAYMSSNLPLHVIALTLTIILTLTCCCF